MIYRNNNYGPIDRFCAKHPRFGIPNLMKIIVIAQIAVFVFNVIGGITMNLPIGSGAFTQFLYFAPYEIARGQVWRLVTWLFVPNSTNPFYLLIGCYFYYWIGSMLEREWGTAKFNLFYLCGAVLSMVVGTILVVIRGGNFYLDISRYLNTSIFIVLATMFGEHRVYLFFMIPIKMKWVALIDVVSIAMGMFSMFRQGWSIVALYPLISIINYVIFSWDFWSVKLGVVRRRADPTVINFKKAQKEVQKKAQETKGYLHKCAVCGVTDADDPNMEFRYCSKCDGYYCYCEKHINNHVHIHED